MGNQQQKVLNNPPHALFGQPQGMISTNGDKFHTVGFPVRDENQGKSFISQLRETDSFTKKHLLLSSSFTTESILVCSNVKIVNCTFPFYPFSLQQQIQSRSQRQSFLSKIELQNSVYQIIQGARNFDKTNKKVGDIRPSQILLDQKKTDIKLVNFYTSPYQETGLQKCFEHKQSVFLAPQQLKALQKGQPNPEINLHKADSFSLGLTILSMGNLKKLYDLYDFPSFTFSWAQLSNELEVFQSRYGHFLAQIVKGFVQNEPRSRLYIGQVGAILQFYERQLFKKIDFQPDFALMNKQYDLHYSGPRSQQFLKWLNQCGLSQPKVTGGLKNFGITNSVIQVTGGLKNVGITNSVILSPPVLANTPVKVYDSRVRFSYSSPKTLKVDINDRQ